MYKALNMKDSCFVMPACMSHFKSTCIMNKSMQWPHMHAPPAISQYNIRYKPAYKPPLAYNEYDYTASVKHTL